MTKEEIMAKIDEAHARLVEKYGALAPSKEYYEMIVMGEMLERSQRESKDRCLSRIFWEE